MIVRFREKGYLTQAFFKVATGGQTGVICNCHPDTCVSLQATKFAKKFDRKFTMNADSGYAVRRDEKKCKLCATCAEVCPVDCIEAVKDKSWSYDSNSCLGCELCVEHCPEKALLMYRDSTKNVPLDIDIVKKEYVKQI
jgi:Pyruvate/2-oxoacid:ferredoxin oxidoreductase delta subunit